MRTAVDIALLTRRSKPVPALDLDFIRRTYAIAGNYVGLTTAGSFTRNSKAWDRDLVEYPANEPRVTASGLLMEGARTNALHDSFNPATQTRTLAPGSYTLSVIGTGNCALSGGPSGTASDGAPVTFSLGSSTAVTFTVSGSLQAFQCEDGAWSSSPIKTPIDDGATRQADLLEIQTSGWMRAEQGRFVVSATAGRDEDALLLVEKSPSGTLIGLNFNDGFGFRVFTPISGAGGAGNWNEPDGATVGLSYDADGISFAVDGAVEYTTSGDARMFDHEVARPGFQGIWGHLTRVRYDPVRGSDAQLAALTA